jgi:hypothetical protein
LFILQGTGQRISITLSMEEYNGKCPLLGEAEI